MVDIETLGTTSYSSILSIGAVEFDILTGETGKTFDLKIDIQSCVDAGLKLNPATIMWWMKQSDDARTKVFGKEGDPKKFTLEMALKSFNAFCHKEYQVWGNSARFDLGLLENAYNAVNLPVPWDFRKERCLRTLISFAPEVKTAIPFTGTAHDAVDDCLHQIKQASAVWNKLTNRALPEFEPLKILNPNKDKIPGKLY